jgi:hypothetical protein
MAELKVGGEVDAFCTKCKMVLAHTIEAIWAGQIKRVRCNTCMGQHAFRRAEPGTAAPRAAAPRASKPSKPAAAEAATPSSYDELIAGKNRADARRYDLKQRFVVGDLVQHPTFGLGVVAAARGLDKIDVAFPGSVKTLMHNRGAAPSALPRPPEPKRPDVELPAAAPSDEQDDEQDEDDEEEEEED